MDRLACVDVPALPLQVLLRREPSWKDDPAAVVAEDKPQGVILWVNEKARRNRVLPGMRYAGALALAPGLRAGVVSPEEIDATVTDVVERLRRFTPNVEPAAGEPGVLWIDASGLSRLHPSLETWARGIRRDLATQSLRASVAVGFTRFGTYAVARSSRGLTVFESPAEEDAAARRVRLDRLGIDPELRDTLAKLGVSTVEGFLRLPEGGIAQRFGRAAERLHRLAAGDLWTPLRPRPPDEPPRRIVQMEHPVSDATALLFLVTRLLPALLAETAGRQEALAELTIRLHLDDARPGEADRVESVRPAAPTLDAAQVLDLVRLRLESMQRDTPLPSGAVEMELTVRGVRATIDQLHLFAQKPKRDLAAAARSFARLRAEYGPDAVVRARLVDSHLPEASFAWEPLEKMPAPQKRATPPRERALVRRILTEPVKLPHHGRHDPDGWMLRGLEYGPVLRLSPASKVQTRWWRDAPIEREYHFAETRTGHLSWVFHDLQSREWFLHGEVG